MGWIFWDKNRASCGRAERYTVGSAAAAAAAAAGWWWKVVGIVKWLSEISGGSGGGAAAGASAATAPAAAAAAAVAASTVRTYPPSLTLSLTLLPFQLLQVPSMKSTDPNTLRLFRRVQKFQRQAQTAQMPPIRHEARTIRPDKLNKTPGRNHRLG